jgi:hypothetical protein
VAVAGVAGDPKEPRLKPGGIAQSGEGPAHAQEYHLAHVVDGARVAEQPKDVPGRPLLIEFDKGSHGALVARARPLHNLRERKAGIWDSCGMGGIDGERNSGLESGGVEGAAVRLSAVRPPRCKPRESGIGRKSGGGCGWRGGVPRGAEGLQLGELIGCQHGLEFVTKLAAAQRRAAAVVAMMPILALGLRRVAVCPVLMPMLAVLEIHQFLDLTFLDTGKPERGGQLIEARLPGRSQLPGAAVAQVSRSGCGRGGRGRCRRLGGIGWRLGDREADGGRAENKCADA